MKKQNYVSAVFMILIFIISVSYGYWLGKAEYNELLESYLDSIESNTKRMHSKANLNIFVLESLEDKEGIENLKKFYLNQVQKDLKFLGTPEETLFPYVPKESLIKKAKNYQLNHCNDKCLGI